MFFAAEHFRRYRQTRYAPEAHRSLSPSRETFLPEFRRPMETAVIHASELTAVIPATGVVLAGSTHVRVETPLTSGSGNVSCTGDSESLPFTINPWFREISRQLAGTAERGTGMKRRAGSSGWLAVVVLGGRHFT